MADLHFKLNSVSFNLHKISILTLDLCGVTWNQNWTCFNFYVKKIDVNLQVNIIGKLTILLELTTVKLHHFEHIVPKLEHPKNIPFTWIFWIFQWRKKIFLHENWNNAIYKEFLGWSKLGTFTVLGNSRF